MIQQAEQQTENFRGCSLYLLFPGQILCDFCPSQHLSDPQLCHLQRLMANEAVQLSKLKKEVNANLKSRQFLTGYVEIKYLSPMGGGVSRQVQLLPLLSL